MDQDALLAKWNQRHQQAEGVGEPARVLSANRHLLPATGSALDLACGRGGNALLLAGSGLATTAWDFSEVAIDRLRREASSRRLQLSPAVRDVIASPPAPESFDVIVVSYFLERNLVPAIMAALRPGGLLFYETFVRDAVHDTGPACSQWRLADNELLNLFRPLRIHYYREEGSIGDTVKGIRDVALMVASRTG